MPYGKSNIIKNTNVNYLGKDFNDLKSSLILIGSHFLVNGNDSGFLTTL